MNNVINVNLPVEFEKYANPKYLLITQIEFLNGEKTLMFTAYPKGISCFHIQEATTEALKRQTNILEFSSNLFENNNGKIELISTFSKVILSEKNRLPMSSALEYYNPKIGVSQSCYN